MKNIVHELNTMSYSEIDRENLRYIRTDKHGHKYSKFKKTIALQKRFFYFVLFFLVLIFNAKKNLD